MSRVVVVGAGAGGLATAIRLRAKGHDVTVLERGAEPGGKLASFERDGFVFDTGPSLFTLPAVYRDLFLRTGAPLEEVVDLQPLHTAFAYRWADGTTAELPGADPGRIADALGDALGGSASADWRRLMARGGEVWRITRRPFLESPLAGAGTLIGLARDPRDVRTVAPFTTLRRLGREYLRDPRLVTLLDRYATYTGSDPRRAPAALVTVPYVEQVFGAWHLGGGVATLARALAERATSLGITIETGVDIRAISTSAAGVDGVVDSAGKRRAADIVVANADASRVFTDLVSDPRLARARRRLRRTTPSLAGFVMLLALRGRTPGLAHHNVSFPADYDAEFDAVFGRSARPVPDPTVYVCAPDDPAMRPDDDSEAWFVLVNAPRHGPPGPGTVDWRQPGLAESYADRILDVMGERGLDIRRRLLWREIRTPADLEVATGAPGGSIYGSSSNGPRAAFMRPANATAVPGLYLVGGSSHPGGGLPLVGLSAQIVAGLIGPA